MFTGLLPITAISFMAACPFALDPIRASAGCWLVPAAQASLIPRMRLRRFIRIFLIAVAALVLAVAVVVGSVWRCFHPSIQRTNGAVYSHRHGQNPTLDVLRPAKPSAMTSFLKVSLRSQLSATTQG